MDTRCSRIVFAFALGMMLGGCAGGSAGPNPPTALAAAPAGRELPPPSTLNWENFGMDPGLSAYNSKETTLNPSNVPGLGLLWSSTSANVQGIWGLVEDGGKFFVESTPGGGAAYLTAIDQSTGAQAWSSELYNFGCCAGIAAGDGLVFAPCELGGNVQEQGLCAFGQTGGKLKWSYTNSCNCSPPSYVGTPPVYSKGVVYFEYVFGSTGQNGYFIAADAKSGTPLWTYGCSYNCGWVAVANGPLPAVGGSNVYFACNNYHTPPFNGLCAFNASNGNLLWKYSGASGGNSAVSVAGGTIYMQQDGNGSETITALNSSGSVLWTNSSVCPASERCANPNPPAVGGGRVYVLGGGNALYALNAKSGAQKWVSSPACGGYVSSPSVANGVVYLDAGIHCEDTYALSAANGNLLWQAPYGGYGYGAPPIILNGTLYANCGALCAYGLSGDVKKRR
ncbi:MAG: PQQ-like beta-propeller repeat protein [Candidatus Eremiobacteraeota bacterium]|nr:PQQ-like beta-propeller repeat protein [Candidatus Eremiobacteraeota bacterium]